MTTLEVPMNIYTDGSWSVALSAEGDSLIIQATDYHAGPLKLPLRQLERHIASGEKLADEEIADDLKTELPNDIIEIRKQSRWTIALSKKQKCLFIKTKNGEVNPLRLSRKELYRIGKMMNKRVKNKN